MFQEASPRACILEGTDLNATGKLKQKGRRTEHG